jgi:hypothetical protein
MDILLVSILLVVMFGYFKLYYNYCRLFFHKLLLAIIGYFTLGHYIIF